MTTHPFPDLFEEDSAMVDLRINDRVTLHKEFIIPGRCASPNGSILCDMSVNKTGFVPGESITPQVYVTNHSSRAIQTVHLTFAQAVLLQISEEQQHTEVLRLFAARLKARPSNPNAINSNDMELSVQASRRPHGDDNPSLFSSSLSPSVVSSSSSSSSSCIASSNKPDGLQFQRSTVHQSSSTKKFHPRTATVGVKSVRTENQVVVAAHGGSGYFEDVIHVPPLPATGLAGRQQMIRIDYMLILRLRLLGDEEGKFDQKMQIPITIGSDPTRETSFTNCTEVVPCYALFNYASGEVIEYDPSKQLQAGSKRFHLSPVYRYFKPRTAQGRPNSDQSGQQSLTRSRVCSPPIHHSHARVNPVKKTVHKDGHPTQVRDHSKKSGRCTPVLNNPHATDHTYSPLKPAFSRDKVTPTHPEQVHCKTESPCRSPPILLLARQRFYDDGAQSFDRSVSASFRPSICPSVSQSVTHSFPYLNTSSISSTTLPNRPSTLNLSLSSSTYFTHSTLPLLLPYGPHSLTHPSLLPVCFLTLIDLYLPSASYRAQLQSVRPTDTLADHYSTPVKQNFQKYSIKDSFELISDLDKITLVNELMCYIDVQSLFVNAPLHETIDYICELVEMSYTSLPLPADILKETLLLCTENVSFRFLEQSYRQIDGVAMGSPLGPILADFFVLKIEQQLATEIENLSYYKRYVDGTLLFSRSKQMIDNLVQRLNSCHPNL
ncbi:uncharacterized protein DEA37_0014600 [Paragonimus westermani]|uniref:Reverse transcriptase domain-containing protein n=1 Tax=Paragonimus westermani TaxID=34504 RepID=A0A5J4NX01_9TREM|nr:uncharacterized protein DEA37_0014600 [Paragonimus westermani]